MGMSILTREYKEGHESAFTQPYDTKHGIGPSQQLFITFNIGTLI